MVKYWKPILGVTLMMIAIAGFIFWETQGRQTFLMEKVLVASKELPAGTEVRPNLFHVIGVPEEGRIEGAYTEEMLKKISGYYTTAEIPRNGQVNFKSFVSPEEMISNYFSIYSLPKEWLAMRSSSLRRGDKITLYRISDYSAIGEYQVAFVKSMNEQEVSDPEGKKEENLLERTFGSSEIDHLEILTDLEGYREIRRAAMEEPQGLLVVQTMNQKMGGEK